MPFGTGTPFCSRFPRPVAGAALAVMLSVGLAGCGGGGGSGGGEQVMIMPGPQAPPQESPDLVVESLSAIDPAPSAGARFTLSVSVRNAGSGSAAAAALRFYRSDDAAIAPSDEEVGYADVPELAASESFDTEVVLLAPTSGTHHYGACVNTVSGESDAENNCSASVRVTAPAPPTPAPAPQPNLVLESPSVSDDNPAAGGFFWLEATLRIARGRSEGFWLSVYRSDDAAFTTSNLELKDYRKLFLAEGDKPSRRIGVFLRAPTSEGEHYYRACVITTNNCSASVKIEVSHDKPNLVIVGRSWPNGVHAGQKFFLTAQVANNGGESEATTMRFFLLPDRTSPTSSGAEEGAVTVPALATRPGDAEPVFFEGLLFLTAPSTPGTYYYVACVDAVTDESRTTDNCSRIYEIKVV